MDFRVVKQFGLALVGASALALAACGGGSETPEPAPAPEASTPETTTETVTEATIEAVEETTSTVTETTEAAVETATETAEAVTEAGTETAEAATETVTETVAEVVEAATGGDDRVSAEVAAAYAALTGDPAAGRRVFTKCMSCHVVAEGQNRVGPSLYGIIGREAGSIEGFRYSDANANSGIVWTKPVMFAYLENPQRFIPGTNMAFPGLPSAQERADVIAYIDQESSK